MKSLHITGTPWSVNYNRFSEVLDCNGAVVAVCQKRVSLVELQERSTVVALSPQLYDIVKRLGALADGLVNGNSSAEHAASELAKQASELLA